MLDRKTEEELSIFIQNIKAECWHNCARIERVFWFCLPLKIYCIGNSMMGLEPVYLPFGDLKLIKEEHKLLTKYFLHLTFLLHYNCQVSTLKILLMSRKFFLTDFSSKNNLCRINVRVVNQFAQLLFLEKSFDLPLTARQLSGRCSCLLAWENGFDLPVGQINTSCHRLANPSTMYLGTSRGIVLRRQLVYT